jgi:maltose O-acetyltransferase
MSEMRERMRAGQPYRADDPVLRADYQRAQRLVAAFNATAPDDLSERAAVLAALLGSMGAGVVVTPPLRLDYGQYVHLADGVFLNYDCILLDVCEIRIGARSQLGPRVQLLTATHPLDPAQRAAGWESGAPVSIGADVWIGAGALILPGVSVGDGSVIGAGSVVTEDVPAGVLAVGAPARVVRPVAVVRET